MLPKRKITISLKELPYAPYHRADVSTWYDFRNTVYCYIEGAQVWVRANKHPVVFADADLAADLTERLEFYLMLRKYAICASHS